MSTLHESLIILGTIALVVVLLTVVLVAFRKGKHRQRPGGLSRSAWPESAHRQSEAASAHPNVNRQSRRQRKRRRNHRPRNPTLAETGGLPPARPNDQSPPVL